MASMAVCLSISSHAFSRPSSSFCIQLNTIANEDLPFRTFTLLSVGDGNWTATWVPGHNAQGFSIAATAHLGQPALQGRVQVTGQVPLNPAVPVVNPLTGTVYPAGTQIPIASLNPFAAALLGGLPTLNGPGRSNNYEALLLIRDYSDKYDAKIDGQINDRMNAFLRFSQRKDVQY